MIVIKENERLVHAGKIVLRGPDGKVLSSMPQYMIVKVEQADPARITELQPNERLVLAGGIHNDKKSAEERFAALKRGEKPSPRVPGTPLYIKEDAANINPKTGLSKDEEKACEPLIDDLVSVFSMQMRALKMRKNSGKTRPERSHSNDGINL